MRNREFGAVYLVYALVGAASAPSLFIDSVSPAVKWIGGLFLLGWAIAILCAQGRRSTTARARFGRALILPFHAVM
ncbi:hypothetical protein [Gymnodinialimonas ulvae]|uniref:hypothetical protein n=1 Tax=Gymnodinialimonas ulvae TaxID=3126504 RepID=UPI0030A15E22